MRHFYYYIILFLFILSGCHEEAEINPLYNKYLLEKVEIDIPADLNFDGVLSDDLKREIEVFNNCALFLYNYNGTYEIDLIWPEVRVNNSMLYIELPPLYEDGMIIEYCTVSKQYIVSIDSGNTIMDIGQRVVNDPSHIYTFTFPQTMNIEKETISFWATQYFLTKDGIRTYIIEATFKASVKDGFLEKKII